MAALFRGGPLVEGEQKSGLTYLLEKTIVKGTHFKSASQIVQLLENVGGTLNEEFEEFYTYSGKSLLHDGFSVELQLMKDDWKLGLELLAEILTAPLLSDEEITREKKKQLAAIQTTEDVIQLAARNLLQKTLFGTHPYAHPRIGTASSVAALTPEMVRDCYQQLVVGNNGVVAIVGNIDAEEIVAIASKTFASLQLGVLALQSVSTPEPLKAPHYQEKFQEREQAVIMKGFLGAAMVSPDRPALELLGAECSSMGSRIFKRIRDEKALVYHTDGSHTLRLAPGSFIFQLSIDPKKSAYARKELDRFLEELIEGGFTQEDLEKAQNIILYQEALLHESYANLAKSLAKDELMGLGFEHSQHRREEILGVTLDQMNAVIKKYLGAPGFVEVVVGPKGTATNMTESN
jgi:zinc protease